MAGLKRTGHSLCEAACQDLRRDDLELWSVGSWIDVVERPVTVDEAVDRDDKYAGVALLALVLNRPQFEIVPPRIKLAVASRSVQTRVNALQSVGHYARLHGSIDHDLLKRLRRALATGRRCIPPELVVTPFTPQATSACSYDGGSFLDGCADGSRDRVVRHAGSASRIRRRRPHLPPITRGRHPGCD